MTKPIIGISLDLIKDSAKYHYSSFPWYALRQNYANSVVAAGGVPVMLPCEMSIIDEVMNILQGIVIPGGSMDIDPKHYNQEIISEKVTKDCEERTFFEMAITKKALERNIPYLGICRGMQLLNIVSGGDLIQHLPDHITSDIVHQQPLPAKHLPSHLINIKPATLLHKIANGKEQIMVNSNHHQAPGTLGKGLIISATALDGVVEAIESSQHKFVLGVEWHPEYLNPNHLDFNLFKSLVDAAKLV